MSQETIPVKIEGLVVNDDDVTPTLLNPMNGHIFVTNKVGKRVIEMCDGQRSVEDIIGRGRCGAGDVSRVGDAFCGMQDGLSKLFRRGRRQAVMLG